MKLLTAVMLFLIALNSYAVEIQCNSETSLDYIIKTSESTNVTYIVVLDGDTYKGVVPLDDNYIKNSNDVFKYKKGNINVLIHKKYQQGVIIVSGDDGETINLSNCVEY